MRQALGGTTRAALGLATTLALASAFFATTHALDPRFSADLRISLWLDEASTWSVGGVLFLLAAARHRDRPAGARIAAALGAITITVASFNAQSVPGPLLLAAAIVCALAPWTALAVPPSLVRAAVVAGNLALIAATPTIATLAALPWWLRSFAPIDPLTIPAWLYALPLQWPWIVVGVPVLFGIPGLDPSGCCTGIPVHPSPLITVPAAIVGAIVWYRGRPRGEAPAAWHGPAGRATRRG